MWLKRSATLELASLYNYNKNFREILKFPLTKPPFVDKGELRIILQETKNQSCKTIQKQLLSYQRKGQ